MKQPYRSQFQALIQQGAGTLDIHDTSADTPYTAEIRAYDALVEREIGRVDLHRNSLNPILERFVGPVERILDVGCGTGATTVAMALSPVLGALEVIGADPNTWSLEAATVRARGYDMTAERCRFEPLTPGAPLPFDDASFDLTVCVSAIEYIHRSEDRFALAQEMLRVTSPGGHILLVTPNPLRLRDYHTRRWLGDLRREEGYPWASPPWQLRRMLAGCEIIPLHGHQLRHGIERRGLPGHRLPGWLSFLGYALPWQKLLVRKPA